MSEELRLENQGIYKYEAMIDGKKQMVAGTAIFEIMCGVIKLYTWEIRPHKLWWSTSVTQTSRGIIVNPSAAMMTHVIKHYKYEFTMDLCDAYDMLVELGLPTYEFVRLANELGWSEVMDQHLQEKADVG